MDYFFSSDREGQYIVLSEAEARHALQAHRKREGDELIVVDGRGGRYRVRIEEASKGYCRCVILSEERDHRSRSYRLQIAIAPTKNSNRFEWFIEKATELGVDQIRPIACFHSERRRLRHDRLERIAIAAMKQSKQAYLPQIKPMIEIGEYLKEKQEPGVAQTQHFIAWLGEDVKGYLKDNYQPGCDVEILIGPEGDFTGEEVELAMNNGYIPVSLGETRLRTETAGIIACSQIHFINQ